MVKRPISQNCDSNGRPPQDASIALRLKSDQLASVGSTEASASLAARVGVVGPTRASVYSTPSDPDIGASQVHEPTNTGSASVRALRERAHKKRCPTVIVGSDVRDLRRRSHTAMRVTGACFEIAERPPATPSHISDRMGRDVRIRYSTVGVVPSANSADPSSGRPWG